MKCKHTILIIAALLQFSCGSPPYRMNRGSSEPDSQEKAPSPYQDTVAGDVFTAKEQVQNAIKYLQIGQAKNAYIELQKALKKEPGYGIAVKLIKQITSSPDQYFKEDQFFTYTVEVGDSLSTISKKFLKDRYKFYILAKYNKIDNPSRLSVGQRIKIPGSKPKTLLTKPPVPPSNSKTSDSQIKIAQNYFHEGDYQSAIDLLEGLLGLDKSNTKIQGMLVLNYSKYSQVLAEKSELLEAHTLLKKAITIQPNNKELKWQIKTIEKRQEADELYMVGLNLLQSGEKEKAYSAFKGVLKLEKGHALAKKQIAKLQAGIIDSYYREGMAMYRRQHLKDAIALFDKILLIDSDHKMAKLYRARATELQTRLNEMNKDDN